MISFYSEIKPFTTLEECGDFSMIFENEDYYLHIVGDIGGHGSIGVGKTKLLVQEMIEICKDNSLEDILTKIHQMKKLKEKGMTLFLAKIYIKTPLIEYVGIGNIRILMLRNNTFKELSLQEGIVGYVLPTTINSYLVKLQKNDRLIIATDGVSLHAYKLKELNVFDENIQTVAQNIVENYHNHDDAICSIISYNISSSYQEANRNIYKEEI